MFAVGLGNVFNAFFAIASMLIAIPTGIKVLNWTATMWGGKIHFATPMLFAVTFLIEFVVGGLSGVAIASPPIDWQATDTYLISTVGSLILGLSVIVFVWNIIASLRSGIPAGNNPWNAWTLEWATTSPPPVHNFDLVPPVHGRRPLWDLAHPDMPDK